ncbi:hypothetical protein YT1_p10098 (plasmid) [Rhodococcus ruber]|nr:hypothetical protein YT1_p10098 [Rhodococcus ruber]
MVPAPPARGASAAGKGRSDTGASLLEQLPAKSARQPFRTVGEPGSVFLPHRDGRGEQRP